uniref:DUF3715 domain-containing protein n=1 Tax=Panagrolaimus sp. JU765 TaxID=591449 RepID=A0AC34RA09_9BILA
MNDITGKLDESGTSAPINVMAGDDGSLSELYHMTGDIGDCLAQKIDLSSSKKAFSSEYFSVIPAPEDDSKVKLTYLTPKDDTFKQEIGKIVSGSCFHENLDIQFIDAVRVTNPGLHERCLAYQAMLQSKSYPSNFTYLFMDIGGYDPQYEHKIFTKGIHTGNAPIFLLGDAKTGVYLSTKADKCSFSPLLPYLPHRVLIFKVLLGNVKEINVSNSANPLTIDLSDDFGSHMFSSSSTVQYCNNWVYIYDKHNDNSFHAYPRSIYPYGAVTFCIPHAYQFYDLAYLPYLPKYKVAEYDLHFPNIRNFRVAAHILRPGITTCEEFAINGIVVDKAVQIVDIAATRYMKEFVSDGVLNFQGTEEMRIATKFTNPTIVYSLKHLVLHSNDPDLKKIIKRIRYDDQGFLFHVPNLATLSAIERTEMHNHFGFIVPNCLLITMLGIPFYAADILHCFVLKKIPLTAITHPLRTIRREDMLMGMDKADRIGRADKISDNDVRYALSMLNFPQIIDEGETESEGDNQGIENEELDYDDDVFLGDERTSIDHSVIEMSNAQYETAVMEFKRESEELMEQHGCTWEGKPCFEILGHAPPLKPNKVAVILEPLLITDALIDGDVLSTLMDLMQSENVKPNSVFGTKFILVYHDSMNLLLYKEHKAQIGAKKSSAYVGLQKKYVNEGLIGFGGDHVCNLSGNNMRAALICCMTQMRKHRCNNAVFLASQDQDPTNIELFKTQKIFLTKVENFIPMLSAGDSSFLY